MNSRSRMARLRKLLDGLPQPNQIELIEWIPAGSKSARGRPPGAYQRPGSSVATVVFEGDRPDPAVLAQLRPRVARHAIVIEHGLEVVPVPTENP